MTEEKAEHIRGITYEGAKYYYTLLEHVKLEAYPIGTATKSDWRAKTSDEGRSHLLSAILFPSELDPFSSKTWTKVTDTVRRKIETAYGLKSLASTALYCEKLRSKLVKEFGCSFTVEAKIGKITEIYTSTYATPSVVQHTLFGMNISTYFRFDGENLWVYGSHPQDVGRPARRIPLSKPFQVRN